MLDNTKNLLLDQAELAKAKILLLDQAGTPSKWWVGAETVAHHYAKGEVIWASEPIGVLHGGHDKNGNQSIIEISSMVMVRGVIKHYREMSPIPLEREYLVKRDRNICAYCGEHFRTSDLTMDHVHPKSRGGRLTWTNVLSACGPCNWRKADRRPEEAGMEPLFLPYKPDRNEGLILMNRHVLADQMDYLRKRLPERSRLLM